MELETKQPAKERKFLFIGAVVLIAAVFVCILLLSNRSRWKTEDGYTCYLEKGDKVTGMYVIDGETYYFNGIGHMQTGFQRIDEAMYYFSDRGIMQTGWQTIDGYTYLFDESGIMQTGWLDQDGAAMYLQEDGRLAVSWLELDEQTYYFDENGHMQTGWIMVADKKYYSNDEGIIQCGIVEIDKKQYLFNSEGAMETGWVTYKEDTFFVNEDGTIYTGWKTENNDTYYFSESRHGKMATGKWQIDDQGYYFDEEGKMCTGEIALDDETLFLDENGVFTHRVIDAVDLESHDSGKVITIPLSWLLITTYYHDINGQITDASYISVTVTTAADITYRGNWQLYVRLLSGQWKYIGTGKMESNELTFDFTFEKPLSFDAFTCIPTVFRNKSMQSNIKINEIIYTDYSFGSKNGTN